MTDTAIPIPDDAQARMDQRTEAFRRAVTTMMKPVVRHLAARWEVLKQRHRVRRMMPDLTMRQTMVHGYVPYEEA